MKWRVITCVVLFCGIWGGAQSLTDYQDALSKAILFFQGQRSGKLPANHTVEWRGDSALSDGAIENVNLIGGYYDAGDNVKFVWPMAFSISLLGWAANEYGNEINSELPNLLTAIKWGTTFLLRAHTSSTTLYTQRPEDMDTPRTLYKITSSSPGSEVAADAAAALAATSILFKQRDSNYSARLLRHAKLLFKFADEYRGSYKGSCPFYCSYSGYQDELLWGAAWLYKASGDSTYLNYVSTNEGWSQSVPEFSWDNKFAGAQTLLARARKSTSLSKYKTDADAFVCALMPGSTSVQIKTTPGGLLYVRDSSNLQYASSASMVLAIYSKILTEARVDGVQCGSVKLSPSMIKDFAKSQVDYILGNNPLKMSYMVGFGSKSPTQLHHRGSSIPSIRASPAKIGCNDGYSTWYSSSQPNPNAHIGAVVGGPDANDRFSDSRSDYSHSEPTTYMNAAFIGAAAAFVTQNGRSHLQIRANGYGNGSCLV
ncbi:glycosyl hydrolase 9B15 [Perilla frutescens var. frutescens]|nr:glycosyl hydrolase 9B15 [Perilla frutescens var. frutescens]